MFESRGWRRPKLPALPSRFAWLRKHARGRSRLALYLATMGPGLIAALAGNDAGGIGTYSLAGARYGYRLLWLLFVITFLLALVQEMAARMGAVTQKGLGELIREHYGVGWTLFALGVMFIANTATVVAEFAGIAAAGEIFGLSKYLTVPTAALFMWLLVTRGPFRVVERIFLAICLVQVTYVIAAFKAVDKLPDTQGWNHIMRQLVTPHFSSDAHFLLLCVGVIGTTITPWMQFFLQSNIVDKGIRLSEYRYQKADVYAGAIATNTIAFFIIVCSAAALHYNGITDVKSADDAALALAGPLGAWAKYLFAVGLLAASLLAAAILPLSTAYTYCEAFGWEIGIRRSVRQAPIFYGLFTATISIGAGIVLLPNVPLLWAMLVSQDVNGVLLPIVLVFMLRLINDRRIMGEYVNSRMSNVVAWGSVALLTLLTIVLLISSILGM
ncbi:MAG TPA: Nramp family divalent metal transporter [Abditibacteriaceae bacterium]|nr:Nramp family divalent metal transporter [Abditibacteriaceae bacterium]